MKFLYFLIVLISFASCKKQEVNHKVKDDFNTLMGSHTSLWSFVETYEDHQNLAFFKEVYEKNKHFLNLKQESLHIPKIIHFIWLGPNPFPKESIENVNSWIENHPGWVVKFWTDQKRPLPNSKMETHYVSDFEFAFLKDCYEDSDNYAERSDLLRYELLLHEGGVYVDHDVKCFKPFAPLAYQYDFFCGLEPPHTAITSSSISTCNNLIGSIPHHPILESCIHTVLDRWHQIASAYPGTDRDSVIYRVVNRSFNSFEAAVKEHIGHLDTRDIVLPAAYFNLLDGQNAFYAHHYYATTWYDDETKFEREVRRRLTSISRKNNQILLFNAVILSANLFLLGCLVFQFRHVRRFVKRGT